jgi:hypothetical protein
MPTMSDPNKDPVINKAKAAVSVGLVATMGGLLLLGGKHSNNNADPGQPQRDPNPSAGHVGSPMPGKPAEEYNPAPFYESGKGPDGRIDMLAQKITEDGPVKSYHDNRIDGGTPAPASAGPEHPEQPRN